MDYPHSSRLLEALLTILLTTSLAGCGSDWKSRTYPTSGFARINGEIPEGAMIILHGIKQKPDVRNSTPWGVVNSTGQYKLTTYEFYDGAPIGEYAVTLCWKWDNKDPHSPDRLNNAFFTPDKSVATVTIQKGSNELPPIELTNVKIMPRPKEQPVDPNRPAPNPLAPPVAR